MPGGRPKGMELACGSCNCGTGQMVCRQVHRDTIGGPPWVDLTEGVFYVDCSLWDHFMCGFRKVTGRQPPPPETPEEKFERATGLKLEYRNFTGESRSDQESAAP